MSVAYSLTLAATAAPDAYRDWLAALPDCRPHSVVVNGRQRVYLSEYLSAEFEPASRGTMHMIEVQFGFRPTHKFYMVDQRIDFDAAKLVAYRVAFAFLRDFPDDCHFEQEDSGRFVRRGGELLVNEAAFTYNGECGAFLRPPSLLTPYRATADHHHDLGYSDPPAEPGGR